MNLRNKLLSIFIYVNIFIFIVMPFTMLIPIENSTFRNVANTYRALTGIGFRYMMFAPNILDQKVSLDFELINEKNEVKLVNYKKIVPFIYRIHVRNIFRFDGSWYYEGNRDIVRVQTFLNELKSRYKLISVKALLSKYKFSKNNSEIILNKEIVWEAKSE